MASHVVYNPDYHDDWVWSLAALGATTEDICQSLGISAQTLKKWQRNYPSFRDSLLLGKGAADSKVIKSLYQRAVGYEYDECNEVKDYDPDGNEYSVRKNIVHRKAIPDVTAQMFWLKNRMPDEWHGMTARGATELVGGVEQTQIYLPSKEPIKEVEDRIESPPETIIDVDEADAEVQDVSPDG